MLNTLDWVITFKKNGIETQESLTSSLGYVHVMVHIEQRTTEGFQPVSLTTGGETIPL